MTGGAIAQSIVNGLMSGAIYVLIALGLTLVLSITGIVQLAHGEIYMLGAYGAYYFCTVLGLHYILSVLISTVLVGCFGIVLERVFYRPFRYGEFWPTVIMATGIMLALQTLATVSFGSTTKVVSTPFAGIFKVGGVSISEERVIIIGVSIVLVVACFLFIWKTKMGQAMLAVSQNLQSAALQGINANRVSAVAMFLGCGLASVAGALMGAIFTLSPSMGGFALMKGIAVIILGGMGSITGAVVGGVIIGLIDGIVPLLLDVHMANLISFAVIILVLVFRPTGIMGVPSQ